MSSHSCAVSLISFVLCVSSHRVSSYMCVCIHLASPSHASSTSTSTFPTPSSSPIPFHFPFPSPLRPPSLDPLCAPSLSPPRRVATAGRGERNKLQFSQARPQTQRPNRILNDLQSVGLGDNEIGTGDRVRSATGPFKKGGALGVAHHKWGTQLAPSRSFGAGSAIQVCHTPQRTVTHCNALQRTATHCNSLQHAAYITRALQHTAICCNTLQYVTSGACCSHLALGVPYRPAKACNALQHTATECSYCNTLQHTAIRHTYGK